MIYFGLTFIQCVLSQFREGKHFYLLGPRLTTLQTLSRYLRSTEDTEAFMVVTGLG